jgi:hypothetical protein
MSEEKFSIGTRLSAKTWSEPILQGKTGILEFLSSENGIDIV